MPSNLPIIEYYFGKSVNHAPMTRAENEQARLQAQSNRTPFPIDEFFDSRWFPRDSNEIAPDDGSQAYDLCDKIPNTFPTKVWSIIKSYVHDYVSVDVHWNSSVHTVQIPRLLPGTGMYLWDVRKAVARSTGIPGFLLRGRYHRKGYKPIDLIGGNTELVVWKPCEKQPAVERWSLWWEPDSFEEEHKAAGEYIELSKDVESTIMCSQLCVCNSPICKQVAYIYTVGHDDFVVFSLVGKEFKNLVGTLKEAHKSRYKYSTHDYKVDFYCKDCSKSFNLEWVMYDCFPYSSLPEVGTPVHCSYCVCYRRNRSWQRSVIAKIKSSSPKVSSTKHWKDWLVL